MRYIIDAPSNLYKIGGTLRVPVKVGEGDLCWYDTYLKVESYTEPNRKAIEDEVWELTEKVYMMGTKERELCFGFTSPTEVMANLFYQEAKDKFEAWLKQKDEIHYGDEIISVDDDVKAVMLDCADYESIYVMTENGCVERWKDLDGVKKTGRHFPEVAELLKKMREDT